MKDIKFDRKTLEGIIQTYYVFLKPIMCCCATLMYATRYRSIAFTIIIKLVYNLIIYVNNWIGVFYIGYLHADKYKSRETKNIIKKYNIKESDTLGYQVQHIAFCVMFYISTYKCLVFWLSLLTGNIMSTVLLGYKCGNYSYAIFFTIETLYEQIFLPFYLQNEYRRHVKIGRRCSKFDALSRFGYKLSIIISLIHIVMGALTYSITGFYPFYPIMSFPSYMVSFGFLVWIPCLYYLEKILLNNTF